MMHATLTDALLAHCKPMLAKGNNREWYKWRIPAELPSGIPRPTGKNDFERAIALRKCINVELRNKPKRKIELTNFYISKWGGVRANSPATILAYAREEDATLIARRTKGIASWSKALSIRDPNKYAIYDARVAFSLNALQTNRKVSDPIFFPLVAGRNSQLREPTRQIRSEVKKEKSETHPGESFYLAYLRLLNDVARRLKVTIGEVEMCLFASAVDLSK